MTEKGCLLHFEASLGISLGSRIFDDDQAKESRYGYATSALPMEIRTMSFSIIGEDREPRAGRKNRDCQNPQYLVPLFHPLRESSGCLAAGHLRKTISSTREEMIG